MEHCFGRDAGKEFPAVPFAWSFSSIRSSGCPIQAFSDLHLRDAGPIQEIGCRTACFQIRLGGNRISGYARRRWTNGIGDVNERNREAARWTREVTLAVSLFIFFLPRTLSFIILK